MIATSVYDVLVMYWKEVLFGSVAIGFALPVWTATVCAIKRSF